MTQMSAKVGGKFNCSNVRMVSVNDAQHRADVAALPEHRGAKARDVLYSVRDVTLDARLFELREVGP